MQSRIQKWGNSLALRIPKPFAREIGLSRGTPVDMLLKDGKLIVTPAPKPHMILEQLLEQFTENNIHREIDTGSATGKEAW